MCIWCEGGFGGEHGFEVVSRPAERLAGEWWRGSFDEAAAGGLRSALERAKAAALHEGGLWAGPVVCVSRLDRPDGFSSFAGFAIDAAAALEDGRWKGLDVLELPPLRYVSSWHGKGDGAVVEHYRGLLHAMQMEGIGRDVTQLHHREEHPADTDFQTDGEMRLMIAAEGRSLDRLGYGAGSGRFRAEAD